MLTLLNDAWYLYGRIFAGYVTFFLAWFFFQIKFNNLSLSMAMRSVRYDGPISSVRIVKKCLDSGCDLKPWLSSHVGIVEASGRSIVVHWPTYDGDRVVSKGAIIITFTGVFAYYLRQINIEEMGKHFTFVLEPSWSGYADADILGFYKKINGVIVESSEIIDRVFLNCFPETFIPVSFGASDWVNSGYFKNSGQEKIFDSIYIANTNPIKRVVRYLEAIKNIVASGNENYLGCLVCASWGGAEEFIQRLVDSHGVKKNVVLKFSLSGEEVVDHLNKSKTNVLLSYKEGSNRSLFESMFCNIPVICLSENVGVNKSYINEFTGLLIPNQFLEDGLMWMKDNFKSYQPARWANSNISPATTTKKLKDLIGEREFARPLSNKRWYVKTNAPEVKYIGFDGIDHKVYTNKLLTIFGSTGSEVFSYSESVADLERLFEIDIQKVETIDASSIVV